MSIMLLIKGTECEATREAERRGMVLKMLPEHRANETRATVPDVCLGDVVRWYCDGAIAAPYAVGTLLFYRDGVRL